MYTHICMQTIATENISMLSGGNFLGAQMVNQRWRTVQNQVIQRTVPDLQNKVNHQVTGQSTLIL